MTLRKGGFNLFPVIGINILARLCAVTRKEMLLSNSADKDIAQPPLAYTKGNWTDYSLHPCLNVFAEIFNKCY